LLAKVECRLYNTLRDEQNGWVKLSEGFFSGIRWCEHTEIEQRQQGDEFIHSYKQTFDTSVVYSNRKGLGQSRKGIGVNREDLEVSGRSEDSRKGLARWKVVAGMHICATVLVWCKRGT
jgi:hypothetical protein